MSRILCGGSEKYFFFSDAEGRGSSGAVNGSQASGYSLVSASHLSVRNLGLRVLAIFFSLSELWISELGSHGFTVYTLPVEPSPELKPCFLRKTYEPKN